MLHACRRSFIAASDDVARAGTTKNTKNTKKLLKDFLIALHSRKILGSSFYWPVFVLFVSFVVNALRGLAPTLQSREVLLRGGVVGSSDKAIRMCDRLSHLAGLSERAAQIAAGRRRIGRQFDGLRGNGEWLRTAVRARTASTPSSSCASARVGIRAQGARRSAAPSGRPLRQSRPALSRGCKCTARVRRIGARAAR